jgi:amino acid transporter, AAT family
VTIISEILEMFLRAVRFKFMNNTQTETSRGLKERHLHLMAIGGAIGAAFFLGTGIAIKQAGPGLLIGYLFIGLLIYVIIRALGELTLAYPSAGSFSAYATRFIGPLAGQTLVLQL